VQLFIYDTTIIRGATFSRAIQYSTSLCQSTTPAAIALGDVTFAAQSGLLVANNNRVRASLAAPPVDDSTQFIEGVVFNYTGGASLSIHGDTIGGVAGATYSSWYLTVAISLSGATLTASMRLSPASCAGKARTPVSLTIHIATDPATGVFTLYLTPTQTAALALGDYQYHVLFTPSGSSDKFPILSGTFSVIDA
jgi:hypothetical protein